MNNNGLTLIEVLITIAVMSIIAVIALPSFSDSINFSQVEADSHNLVLLNEQSDKYFSEEGTQDTDIFIGIEDNDARIQKLVTEGYIDRVISPQQSGAYFDWDVTNQEWNLIGGEVSDTYFASSTYSYNFSSDTLDQAVEDGTVSINMDKWSTDDGYLENERGETRIFVPHNNDTYTVTSEAALSSGTNGGYGVFFDTTLKDGDVDSDNGFVFQFDRGYGDGAMIVRPRVNGREQRPVWTLHAGNTDAFPKESEDPDWWTQTHTVEIRVSNVDADTRKAEFYVDGIYLGEYEYENEVDGQEVYTGYRGWGSSTTQFYTLDVE